MTLLLKKETLAPALEFLNSLGHSKLRNPLHNYLRVEVQEGLLKLGAASDEVDGEAALRGEPGGFSFGPVLVPGRLLTEVVSAAPGEEVELSFEEAGVRVTSGRFQSRLAAATPDGFPDLHLLDPENPGAFHTLSLPPEPLREALLQVRYAVSKESYRGVFTGVQLEFREGGFRAVASDGYRLALREVEAPVGVTRKVVLRAPAVDRLVQALRGVEAPLRVGLAEGLVGVVLEAGFGLLRLGLRAMEGEYPDYERVIPKEFIARFRAETAPLKDALRRLLAVADSQNHRVDLLLEEGRLVLEAEGPYGQAREELEVWREGSPISLALDARYLLEALGPAAREVEVGFSGPISPALVRPAEGGGYRAVVVPLKVG
ncbi:DNA polymerase III subunit beta [Fervidobacterium sp.]